MLATQLSLSIAGFLILAFALVHYFILVKKNQTPTNPVLLKAALFISSTLSLLALLTTNYRLDAESGAIIFLALLILPTSALFSYFLATAKTPIGNIKVKVGDTFLPFTTNEFNSVELKDRRTLVKFYRGSWCPYCSAELVMFEELKPKLQEYGVQIIGISNDSAPEQKEHIVRDKITHTLVADSELKIIKQYGVEHHKGLGAIAKDTIIVFDIAMPLPWKMRFKAMAIPTSLLIDETGKIVWIDQSDDYRLRASENLVMNAVTSNFSKLDLSNEI